MTKKSKLTLFLTFVMATLLMLTVGFGLMQPTEKVMASTSVFEMENGASVRLVEGESGIRFRVKMDEATKNKVEASSDAGMLIFPQAYLTADVVSAGKFLDESVGLYDYIDVDNGSGNMQVYSATDGMWYANGCITGILSANYDLDFAAIAYYYDGTDYVYASFDADFGRSITQVLSSTYLKDGTTYGEAIDAIYGDWFGTETNPIQINDKEEYDAFVSGINDLNTYAGKYINIEQNIDLGEGDGSDVTPIPAVFAGTLTANENVKITYKSTTNDYVPAAETYTVTQGIYECDFDIGAKMWTDKVLRVKREKEFTSTISKTSLTSYDKEDFDTTISNNDIESAIGYEKTFNNYFFALDLGFDLEDVDTSKYTHLTFKLAYDANDGVTFTNDTIQASSYQNALMPTTSLTQDGANTWVEYKFAIEDVITNQNASIIGGDGASTVKIDSEPGYIRLFYIAVNTPRYNIYVADVQFVRDFSSDYTFNIVNSHASSPWSLTEISVEDAVAGSDPVGGFTTMDEGYGSISNLGRVGLDANRKRYVIDFGVKLTVEDLSKYTHLQVWLGFNDISIATEGSYKVSGLCNMGVNISPTNSGMLVKYLIPVADVIAAQGTDTSESETTVVLVSLGGTYKGNCAAGTRPYIYFGDVQFVTISES